MTLQKTGRTFLKHLAVALLYHEKRLCLCVREGRGKWRNDEWNRSGEKKREGERWSAKEE